MAEQMHFHGRLTSKQTRRAWRCLLHMANNYPVNPMDVAARSKAADENREAAQKLSHACMDAVEELGAVEVNRLLTDAEDILGLERVDGQQETPKELKEGNG